jgi:hypothetical protein
MPTRGFSVRQTKRTDGDVRSTKRGIVRTTDEDGAMSPDGTPSARGSLVGLNVLEARAHKV